MAHADQEDLLTIFQDGRLQVPRYQRSYAWNKKQITDLLEDIEYVIQRKEAVSSNRDVVHYFGTIVLDKVREIDSPSQNEWTLYDIVDGQQRLTSISMIVGCICEFIDVLEGKIGSQGSIARPENVYRDSRDYYIKWRNMDQGRRLEPATLTENAYSKLVISERPPENVLEQSNVVLPARKLARAKRVTIEWLESKLSGFTGTTEMSEADESDLRDFFDYLNDMLSVIGNNFEVTKYDVESTAEAGRLFEVVNDRGKDLTTAEKIKSHLLYCSGEVSQLDAEEVARDFNEAVETITMSGCDEEIVDQFVERHWEMFTGESNRNRPEKNIDETHRRLKQIDRYAALSRDDDKLANWVKTYVSSLLESASAFTSVYNPEKLASEYSDIPEEIIDRLRSIENSGAQSNFRPLLMASYMKNGATSSQFYQLIKISEIFSFRAYQVMNRSTTLLRRTLKQQAHKLFSSDKSEEYLEELFGTTPADNYDPSPDDAADRIVNLIDKQVCNRSPESEFIKNLRHNDVIDGKGVTGWGGFNTKSTIMFLLYEYERYLRDGSGSTNLHTLVDFGTFDEDAEIEHIKPENPEDASDEFNNHEDNINRLGNLAFLWPEDNQQASNEDYQTKYNSIYHDSGVKTLEELPSPSDGWDLSDVSNREEDLVEFSTNRWSGNSVARVFIQDSLSWERRNEVREAIFTHISNQNDTDREYISSVKFESEISSSPTDGTNMNKCNSCGGMMIESVETDTYQCSCGESLTAPPYQVETGAIISDDF